MHADKENSSLSDDFVELSDRSNAEAYQESRTMERKFANVAGL